ncbi:hypothetical protein [Streptomyces blattellae]|uniref:hypothetical protein n=1 Tax=Streptomyces blattellae TaxID=2569855 RepID=UPI0012B9A631|nr:hypothetical protein [Streptomyces blattellae]
MTRQPSAAGAVPFVKVLRDRGVAFDQPDPQEYTFGVRIEAVDPDGNRSSPRRRNQPGSSDN